jgi:hypothetical protein
MVLLAMDDSACVEVLECIDDLHDIALDLDLGQSLPALDELVQSLIGAQFQQDVDVLMVLEHMLELNDVRVLQRLVDLNFRN